jgi:hypothetical protein
LAEAGGGVQIHFAELSLGVDLSGVFEQPVPAFVGTEAQLSLQVGIHPGAGLGNPGDHGHGARIEAGIGAPGIEDAVQEGVDGSGLAGELRAFLRGGAFDHLLTAEGGHCERYGQGGPDPMGESGAYPDVVQ